MSPRRRPQRRHAADERATGSPAPSSPDLPADARPRPRGGHASPARPRSTSDVHEPVDEIVVCNAAELEIADGHARAAGGGRRSPATVTPRRGAPSGPRSPSTAPLGPGRATLRCSFAGVLNDKLRGFYRSTFTDEDGRDPDHRHHARWSRPTPGGPSPAWTSPTARRSSRSPSWSTDDLAAFSNSPVVAESRRRGRPTAVRFAPTMKMSTYLVAFIVGPARGDRAASTSTGCRSGSSTRRARRHLTALRPRGGRARAAASSPSTSTSPTRPTSSTWWPSPTSPSGPWRTSGCVTFRETALLVDPAGGRPGRARAGGRRRRATRSPTCGSATSSPCAGGRGSGSTRPSPPSWRCSASTPSGRPGSAGSASASSARRRWPSTACTRTRPIEYPVGSPEEADGMFDVLTYQKGGSVLRMLEQYLGAEVFRDGVRRYLRDPRLRQHRDRRPVGRPRGGERPAGPGGDGHLDPPGRPPAGRLRDGHALPRRPFSYGRPRADRARSASAWRCPVLAARSLDRRRRPSAGSCSTAAVASSAPVRSASRWSSTPAAGASTGSPTTPHQLAALGRTSARARPRSSGPTCSPTPGRWCWPAGPRSATSSALAGRARRGHEPGTFAPVAGALALCDRAADDETAADAGRGDPGPPRAAAGRARLGAGARRGRAHPHPARSAARHPRAPRRRTTASAPRRPGRFDAARRRRRRRSTPTSRARCSAVVADQLRPGDYDAFSPATETPATPQEELRYLTRAGRVPRRRARHRAPSTWP